MDNTSNRLGFLNHCRSIEISYKLKGDHDTAESLRGGYQVAVNGERVHRYQDELPSDDTPWGPEFLGVYLLRDFMDFLETTEAILDHEPTLREFDNAYVAEVGEVLFLQRLSEDFVRIGAMGPHLEQLVPASKRGYLVPTEHLIDETISAVDRLAELMAENLSETRYNDEIESFRSVQAELMAKKSQ